MNLTFDTDPFHRLTCNISNNGSHAIITSSDLPAAAEGLSAALASVEANGLGECFWKEAAGEYRWVFRRDGDNVRVAVLWSTGVMTGWEHVLWAECPIAEFGEQVRTGLSGVTPPAR